MITIDNVETKTIVREYSNIEQTIGSDLAIYNKQYIQQENNSKTIGVP